MSVIERVEIRAVTGLTCDLFRYSARLPNGELRFATVQAHWGFALMELVLEAEHLIVVDS